MIACGKESCVATHLERPKVREYRCIITTHESEARGGSDAGDRNVFVWEDLSEVEGALEELQPHSGALGTTLSMARMGLWRWDKSPCSQGACSKLDRSGRKAEKRTPAARLTSEEKHSCLPASDHRAARNKPAGDNSRLWQRGPPSPATKWRANWQHPGRGSILTPGPDGDDSMSRRPHSRTP